MSTGTPPLDPDATATNEPSGPPPKRPFRRRSIAVNTAIFSIATGLSRVAGLFREILASSYFATSGAFSAFTIAFQIPNLLRMLVADQAVTSAFVPVFTELLEQRRRADAFRLASTLFLGILLVLGTITLAFIVLAPVVMPLFTGDEFTPFLDDLTAGLSQLLFPIVVLLGLNGLCVGILNAYDHFTIPAVSQVVWNLVIIGCLIGLRPLFDGADQLYAYAIGVLAGTTVQFLMAFPVLRAYGFRFQLAFDWRDPRVARVVKLMIPVTIALGIINVDHTINTTMGSLVSDQAPRAIDAAFRIYMLPQGMFSVALATVLFPALARYAVRGDRDGLRRTMANGIRQIYLLLIPAGAFTLVLAEPVTQLIYEHGEFGPESTDLVAEALLWYSISLPLNGANLLLTRTFFSLQRPWLPMWISLGSVLVAGVAAKLLLYPPFGIAGLVIGTAVGNAVMVTWLSLRLRPMLGGLEGRETAIAVAKILAAAALLAGVAYGTWYGLDAALGESLVAQIVAVGAAAIAGLAVYALGLHLLRLREAHQIYDLIIGRFRRRRREQPRP